MRLYLNSFPCSRVGENYTNYKKLSYSLGVYPQNFHSAINTSRNKKIEFCTAPTGKIYLFCGVVFSTKLSMKMQISTSSSARRLLPGYQKCQIKYFCAK